MPKIFTIVGIDPGTTVGISVLDFDGNLILTTSSKDMSINDVVEKLLDYGVPSIVATDVNSIPQTVEKIAVSLGAKLFFPSTSISIKEKNEIAKMFPSVKNAHERDSLSAAFKAHQFYINKFDNIDARLKEIGKESLSEKVKALVVKGRTVSKAIELLTADRSGSCEKGGQKDEAISQKEYERDLTMIELQSRIANQREYIVELSDEISNLKKELNSFERKITQYNRKASIEANRSKKILSRNNIIKKQQIQILELRKRNEELQRNIEEIREIRALDLKDKVMVCKFLDQFNRSAILELDKTFSIRKGDVIYINDCSGGGRSASQLLCERGVRAVIYGKGMSHSAKEILQGCDIALIGEDRMSVKMHEDFAIVDKALFEQEYEKWSEHHKISKKEEVHDWLNDMIAKYRYERRKKTK